MRIINIFYLAIFGIITETPNLLLKIFHACASATWLIEMDKVIDFLFSLVALNT
jgi:hypothetical protein